MEQNNFEKDVHQKLGGLKIAPSDSVWTNIEKHIGKKDKKGKLVFIFFFLAVLLLSGTYWLFNSTKNNAPQSHQFSQLKKDSKPTNKADSSFGKSKIIWDNNSKNIDSESISIKKIKKNKADSQNKIAKRNEKEQRKLIDDFTLESKKNYSKKTNNEDFEIALNNVGKLIEKKTNIIEIANKNGSENITRNIKNQISDNSFLSELKTEIPIRNLVAKTDSLIKKGSKNRWIFGITFSGGGSLIGNNILERNYPLMNMNANAPSAGISNGGNPSYYYNPSPIKNSTAFIAGVLVEKRLSAKSKISLGISYKYYSLTNKVGNKIDSAVFSYSQYLATNNSYSSSLTQNSYRNNFHYLEVPVSIKIQINKNKKLPLFWNGGINLSELISSNALQFKSNPGMYYSDNSMFNKTQFGLHTGFSIMLFAKEKTNLTIGPDFYYSPTNIAKKGLYNKMHFSFVGIQANILFHKK